MSEKFDSIVVRLNRMWAHQSHAELSGDDELAGDESKNDSVGKYRLLRLLGTGAFGVVYQARDESIEREVALKLPRLEVLMNQEKRERFAHEALVASQLEHPNIVRVYEAQLSNLEPYIASELCLGGTLEDWMASHPVDEVHWSQVALLVAEVSDAVGYAHDQAIYHRDIKPANIMIDERVTTEPLGLQWLPRLTDFGLAKFIDVPGNDTRSSLMLGTPAYLSPEHFSKATKTDAYNTVDIYSLGVVLFELLTRRLPIEGDNYVELLDNIRIHQPSSLRAIRPELPPALQCVVEKCLQKNPSARYSSAEELAADLRNVVAGRPIEGRASTMVERLSYWSTRPQRVAQAGWYACSWHLIVALWVLLASMVIPLIMDVSAVDWGGFSFLAIKVACLSFGPVIVAGWMTAQGNRLGLYMGLILTSVKFPLLIRTLFFESIYFDQLFLGDKLLQAIVKVLFIFCMGVQLSLYVCAVRADRKHNVCTKHIRQLFGTWWLRLFSGGRQ